MVYFPTDFNPKSLQSVSLYFASPSIKFSESILRECVPLLEHFFMEGSLNDNSGLVQDGIDRLIKGLQKKEISTFCDYLKKCHEQGKASNTMDQFIQSLKSGDPMNLSSCYQ